MTLDEYAQQLNSFMHNGLYYSSPVGMIQQTLGGTATERPADNFQALTQQAYASNGVVFACMLVRQVVFSGIRFQFQRIRNGKPSDTFGASDLAVLEEPWPGGTTQDLLARMIQDADLAGNAYIVRDTSLGRLGSADSGDQLVRLRPDWVQIVGEKRRMDSGRNWQGRPNASRGSGQVGWVKRGYVYWENGVGTGDPVPFDVSEVAHFAPNPDPLAVFSGMSWLTPILREIQADHAMTRHQRKFFDNGATPNMIVKHAVGADRDAVLKWADEFDSGHAGVDNAHKTLHLYPGADATVVGTNLQQIDFDNVRAGGEVRIAMAANVPPVIAGLSKGLDASTFSNYSQARRRFADGTIRPLWQNASGSLKPIMKLPGPDTRLWYDASDVSFLREDEADAAGIQQVRAATIASLIASGFTPESAVAAVESDDFIGLLQHTGLTSVQLQKPGADTNGDVAKGDKSPANTKEDQ